MFTVKSGRWSQVARLSAMVLVAAIGCSPKGSTAASGKLPRGSREVSPVAVTVAPVAPMPIERSVGVVGTLHGREDVTITPKVEGRTSRILHEVGDVVRPGDVLLEIEDTDYELAVAEARRALEMELAKIGLEELPEGSLDMDRIPTVARAAAVEKNALLKWKRVESLPKDVVSEEDSGERQADYRVAQATRDEVIMEAAATLASARHKRALLSIAEQRLRETKVRVPTPSQDYAALARKIGAGGEGTSGSGTEYVVAERFVSEGEMVRAFPSVAAFRLVMDRYLKLKAAVPERHATQVKVGQPVRIAAESHPGRVFAGAISRVSPTVDRASRTFEIEALVANELRELKAGSFVKVSIVTGVDERALTVPEEALVTFAGVTKVFALEDGKARPVQVRTGVRVEGAAGEARAIRVEVSGDLEAGGLVATSGHSQLADGAPVRIRDDPPRETDAPEVPVDRGR